jgi:hypothetical protein
MTILGDLFNFRTRVTLTEDQISDAEGVELSDGLGLADPGKYPNKQWSAQSALYSSAWNYFSGGVLETKADVKTDDGSEPLLYPLQINLVQPIVFMLHAALLGEYDDDNVLNWRVKPKESTDAAKKQANRLQDFINQLYIENDRDGLIVTQASTMQVFGGCVYRARFDPGAHSETNIVIEAIPPEEFFPVWDSSNPHRILEYIFARNINRREAELKYAVALEDDGSSTALYVERWTERDYEVTIEGQPALSPYSREPMRGPNPFIDPITKRQFLPVEYIPTWRAPAGSFYGICPIESVMGLQDEINLQLANIGDTVAENAHRQMWVRGMAKAPERLRRDPSVILNLGIGVPNHVDPELGVVDPPDLPAGTNDFVGILQDLVRNLSYTPRVVWGIDEGSQRSALTLAFRMYQLIAKTRTARVYSMSGFQSFNEKLAMMAISKGVGDLTNQHLRHDIITEFAPIMPQDRQELVDEVVQLSTVDRMSPERAFELLGGIDDPEEEKKRIQEFKKWQAEMEASFQPSATEGRNPDDSKTNKQ